MQPQTAVPVANEGQVPPSQPPPVNVELIVRVSRMFLLSVLLLIACSFSVFGIWGWFDWATAASQNTSNGYYLVSVFTRMGMLQGTSFWLYSDMKTFYQNSGLSNCADSFAGKFQNAGSAATGLAAVSNVFLGIFFLLLIAARTCAPALQSKLRLFYIIFMPATAFFLMLAGAVFAGQAPSSGDIKSCLSPTANTFDYSNTGGAVVHCFLTSFITIPLTVFVTFRWLRMRDELSPGAGASTGGSSGNHYQSY